jgi:peptidoglycan/xylan/chitin deacetylase (PgdA/CDA1 family)
VSIRLLLILTLFSFNRLAAGQSTFTWPDGKRAALSLSFDDARPSQIDIGLPLFARYGAAVTFYVVPPNMEQRLEGWRRAVADGHEIGNHSLRHPCTGNFTWSRDKALENYTSATMRDELLEASRRIEEMIGVSAEVFAYPCGQTFVGRSAETVSYVPIVAELFESGRGWLDEVANDPAFVDLAQLTGIPMDEVDFPEVRAILESAKDERRWVVLAGHDIGEEGRQTTRVEMLEDLLEYAQNPANEIWIAPVGEVTSYVAGRRQE